MRPSFPLACAGLLALARTVSGAEPQCAKDAECLLVAFDCGECNPCPGTEPVAMTPRELAALRAQCQEKPPGRLDPQRRRAVPKCEKCPDARGPRPEQRAACVSGRCELKEVPEGKGTATHRVYEPDPAACLLDSDCILSGFDCSECGRCPKTPPVAVTAKQDVQVQAECMRNPPARLRPRHLGPAAPACSPCAGSITDDIVEYQAVCDAGRCKARVTGTKPRPVPRPDDLLKGK
jgi:hypothetical protein